MVVVVIVDCAACLQWCFGACGCGFWCRFVVLICGGMWWWFVVVVGIGVGLWD